MNQASSILWDLQIIISEASFSPLATGIMTYKPKRLLLNTLTLTGSDYLLSTPATTTKLPVGSLVHFAVY